MTGPFGDEVTLNSAQRDAYGYIDHRGSGTAETVSGRPASAPHTPGSAAPADGSGRKGASEALTVVAVRMSPDFAADASFFTRRGFTPAAGDEWWQELRGRGIIGLHKPSDADAVLRETGTEFGRSAIDRLGFQSGEGADALCTRIRAAGYCAEVVDANGTISQHVIDPDGVTVEIHCPQR